MADLDSSPENLENPEDDDPVSGWQLFYDDPGMLLFLGIASPTILFTLWGVMDVLSVPVAGY